MMDDILAHSVCDALEHAPHAGISHEIARLVRNGQMDDARNLVRERFVDSPGDPVEVAPKKKGKSQ